MQTIFDSSKYLFLLQEQIQQRAQQTEGKLYIEVNGKLLKDDFASRIFPGYDSENKRKLIVTFKHDAEILVCINAKHIIENTPMTKKEIPCLQHTQLTLKKIETATGIKPQLIITHINMEDMYDLIYTFESNFQKKWYKVREHYLQKGFPSNKRHLLSENGFGNNDHIPIFKKIAFVTGIGEESGKLSSAISQIYNDHEIGLESSFCILQTLPLPSLDVEHAINQAWYQKRNNETLTQDEFWETIEESTYESFSIIKELLSSVVAKENLITNYQKASDMLICPTLECVSNLEYASALAEQEMKE